MGFHVSLGECNHPKRVWGFRFTGTFKEGYGGYTRISWGLGFPIIRCTFPVYSTKTDTRIAPTI